jgi:hypothetical protein
LGASDEAVEGSWVWVTGEPSRYWNWLNAPKFLDNQNNEDFLAMNYSDTAWIPSLVGNLHFFVCEWESISP